MKITLSSPVGRGTKKLKLFGHASRFQTDVEIGESIATPRRITIDSVQARVLWLSAEATLRAAQPNEDLK